VEGLNAVAKANSDDAKKAAVQACKLLEANDAALQSQAAKLRASAGAEKAAHAAFMRKHWWQRLGKDIPPDGSEDRRWAAEIDARAAEDQHQYNVACQPAAG
jgi:hypothetical protein